MGNNDQFKETFLEEAKELLIDLEEKLINLEIDNIELEQINEIFRIFHTIKGSSSMFGFQSATTFTHHLETILDSIRKGEQTLNKEIVDHLLLAKDHLQLIINTAEESSPELDKISQRLIGNLELSLKSGQSLDLVQEDYINSPEEISSPKGSVLGIEDNKLHAIKINFNPKHSFFFSGSKPILILKELFELGRGRAFPIFDNIPDFKEIDPEKCYIAWDIILLTKENIETIKDVFIFVQNECDLNIEIIDQYTPNKIGEILIDSKLLTLNDFIEVLNSQKKIGDLLIEEKLVSNQQIDTALEEQNYIKTLLDKKDKKQKTDTLRVSSEKLDDLVNLVGELVTLQATLNQNYKGSTDSELIATIEQFERIISELRDNTMNIRMVPMGTTYSKFRRLVRDLTNELGKEVSFITEGEDTELDKTVIEKLNDPLIHIIRNCIDHGIETGEERMKLGKNEKGKVQLSTYNQGATVVISIEDDGRGISKDRVLKKAIEKGLISKNEKLTEEEIYNLVLSPGFSTAKNITNLSGRGVGLDVVNKTIEDLRGTLKLFSKEHEYTRIEMVLPLTLAIIEGLLVRIENEYFVFPLSSVEACLEFTPSLRNDENNRVIDFRGRVLPFISINEVFNICQTKEIIQQMVVVNTRSGQRGFLVDQVIGDHQTVIKNLGRFYSKVQGIIGATIMGNGSVALLLDVDQLSRLEG